MLTLIGIELAGLATAVGVAVVSNDGKDHTDEMTKYENEHPYSSWEESQPYNP